jgi:hypothetical protein
MKVAVADRVGRIGCHTVDVPAKWSRGWERSMNNNFKLDMTVMFASTTPFGMISER